MKKIIDVLVGVCFGLSIGLAFLTTPSGSQGWGYNDRVDLVVSHELIENDRLTTDQIIFLPGMISHMFFDKNWGENSPWYVSFLVFSFFIFLVVITITLEEKSKNSKIFLYSYMLFVFYMGSTLLYIFTKGITMNGYSW